MPGLVENTLDELDSHLRELKRQVSSLEALRRQRELECYDKSAAANDDVRSSSLMPPSAQCEPTPTARLRQGFRQPPAVRRRPRFVRISTAPSNSSTLDLCPGKGAVGDNGKTTNIPRSQTWPHDEGNPESGQPVPLLLRRRCGSEGGTPHSPTSSSAPGQTRSRRSVPLGSGIGPAAEAWVGGFLRTPLI
jgi:hypothetical protein